MIVLDFSSGRRSSPPSPSKPSTSTPASRSDSRPESQKVSKETIIFDIDAALTPEHTAQPRSSTPPRTATLAHPTHTPTPLPTPKLKHASMPVPAEGSLCASVLDHVADLGDRTRAATIAAIQDALPLMRRAAEDHQIHSRLSSPGSTVAEWGLNCDGPRLDVLVSRECRGDIVAGIAALAERDLSLASGGSEAAPVGEAGGQRWWVESLPFPPLDGEIQVDLLQATVDCLSEPGLNAVVCVEREASEAIGEEGPWLLGEKNSRGYRRVCKFVPLQLQDGSPNGYQYTQVSSLVLDDQLQAAFTAIPNFVLRRRMRAACEVGMDAWEEGVAKDERLRERLQAEVYQDLRQRISRAGCGLSGGDVAP